MINMPHPGLAPNLGTVLESDLAHMNPVSMMGELAVSLAHEITQPIASARNNALAALNFLDCQPPDLGEVREALDCLVGDTDRAGDLIERIREHIKKAPPRKEPFDLKVAINGAIVLARGAITENGVSVQTRLADGLFRVQGNRVQVQQVVLNLVLNAVEAMGSGGAGPRELSISTEQNRPSGVLVAVRDSGPGIDPKTSRARFQSLLHDQIERNGNGAVDLPIDHRCPWRLAVGGSERTSRRCISVHFARLRASSRIRFSRITGRENRAEALYQLLFIHRLTKVTHDPVVHGAIPVSIIRVGSHEDRRNRVPRIEEVPVEFDPGHRRHVDIGDQAVRLSEAGGCEEIGRRWKSLHGITQRPHEPSHGLAKEPIIFNDRNQ
jgi:hypothetical protein